MYFNVSRVFHALFLIAFPMHSDLNVFEIQIMNLNNELLVKSHKFRQNIFCSSSLNIYGLHYSNVFLPAISIPCVSFYCSYCSIV